MSTMDMDRWRVSGLTRADGVAADPIIGTIGYEDAFVHCARRFPAGHRRAGRRNGGWRGGCGEHVLAGTDFQGWPDQCRPWTWTRGACRAGSGWQSVAAPGGRTGDGAVMGRAGSRRH
jgi:hypothetical protein